MKESTKQEIKNTKKVKVKLLKGQRVKIHGFDNDFVYVGKLGTDFCNFITDSGTLAAFHVNRVML